ncbi:MAG TPA: hypothetical protein VLU25_13795 [Acidobacteriota bacterium]|nr:hypothetical protein [Acidobacteriota bacterium]
MNKFCVLIAILALAAACGGANEASQTAGPGDGSTAGAEKTESVRPSPLVAHYAEIQQALAADQLDQAKEAASGLAEITQGEIAELAAQAAQASQLSELRQTFITLSDKVIEQGGELGNYKVAFCPMANDNQGARWLQKEGAIRNPYYGSEMLECGYFPEAAE